MTNEEAIELLKNMHWSIMTKMNREVPSSLALLMAIEALGKDTNVPSKSALEHIHNVVKEDAYKRGYEDGRKDTIPLDWIRWYIDRLKDMGAAIALRDAQAVSVMVDKYMMERDGNETCGPDSCEIGGHNEQA